MAISAVPSFDTLLRDLRERTPEIDAATLDAELRNGRHPVLIDVREADEHAQGAIPSGTRSVLAARSRRRCASIRSPATRATR